jgi:integrase
MRRKDIDFAAADPALLVSIAEDAETLMGAMHSGTGAIGQLLANSAVMVEDGTISANCLEALGFLLSEMGRHGCRAHDAGGFLPPRNHRLHAPSGSAVARQAATTAQAVVSPYQPWLSSTATENASHNFTKPTAHRKAGNRAGLHLQARPMKKQIRLSEASQSANPCHAKVSALVKSFTRAAQSKSTTRSYALDVRHFRAQGNKIPATAEQVAQYLATFAGVLAVATLQHRLIAIHCAHTDKGLESPVKDKLVKRTMQGIRRSVGVAKKQARALVKDDLLEILVAVAKQKPLKAARDKALLLIGFAGAFRRSELVALRIEDIMPHAHGLELNIVRSKTDQEGQGRTVFVPMARSEERCPVKALQAWLELASIGEGPLFRAVNRHGLVVKPAALTPQSVALIVKAAVGKSKGADAARLVSGHSLRAGFVTEAATVGMQTSAIMGQTGHKSLDMLMRYVRPVQKRQIQSLL